MKYSVRLLILFALSCPFLYSQTLTTRPSELVAPAPAPPPEPQVNMVPLAVPAGTPLKVALDEEVTVQRVGQTLHGKTTEPVYAFDKLVIPVGSQVTGKISAIDGVPKTRRTLDALNAEFSPPHRVHVSFDELILPDGRHLTIHTVVSPSSSAVLSFVPAQNHKPGLTQQGKDTASRELGALHDQLKKEWDSAQAQIHEPGKMHRLERYGESKLPYHRQYLDAGTAYNADLQQPLDFGQEPVTDKLLENIGTPPPPGSVVHAVLVTPLSSATAKKGDPVDAVITQPLVAEDHLVLPEGSHLKGTVLQVRPARRLNRNGQLRIVFHQVAPPDGIEQKVEASLEGVEVSKGEHLSLDSEGGAQATTPKTRYLTTAISVGLAATSMGDRDAGRANPGSEPGASAVDGASGFGLVGTVLSLAAHSRAVGTGFAFYGASMSVYEHFIARGHDVVYPKDMSMVVGLGTRAAEATEHPTQSDSSGITAAIGSR
jgi:hypothetical protein